MGDRLRLVVGIVGNAASLFLYAAPVLTFARVLRKKNTEGFSCVPYIIALFNCLLYAWYGLPIVSNKWENYPVVTINGLGIVFESAYILIFFWFASPQAKKRVTSMTIPVVLIFAVTAAVTVLAFHDHRHRKMFVGSIGLVASVAMYGSPLVAMKQVIETKSVQFMPFHLSLFSFFASSLWMTYGFLSHDLFLTSPNLVGSPLGLLQLLFYIKYKKAEKGEEEEEKDDAITKGKDGEKKSKDVDLMKRTQHQIELILDDSAIVPNNCKNDHKEGLN